MLKYKERFYIYCNKIFRENCINIRFKDNFSNCKCFRNKQHYANFV